MYGILSLLHDAFLYATQLDRSLWDFAVEVRSLRDAGLTPSDFRWLVCKGFVRHASEVTAIEEDGRSFERVGFLTLTRRTCLVLTDAGVAFAEGLTGRRLCGREHQDGPPAVNGFAPDAVPAPFAARDDGTSLLPGPVAATVAVPRWDRDRQELRLGEALVKRFKVPAPNQEVILAAFEEEGWPVRIDDPLPVHPCLAAKRRLHETITSLNRHQRLRLINFSGDGSGQGVRWEAVVATSGSNGVH
jgi:hypothetical protein